MSFQTKHGESLSRIIAAYQGGPALIGALETYCSTLVANARTAVKNDFAETVCEGLHSDAASGLKCLKCYLAEQHFTQEAVVQAEIDSMRGSTENSVPEADPDGEV